MLLWTDKILKDLRFRRISWQFLIPVKGYYISEFSLSNLMHNALLFAALLQFF